MVSLLAAAGGFTIWWETPAREGVAYVRLSLRGKDIPPGTRGTLWIGPTGSWKGAWNPAEGQIMTEGKRLVFGPRSLQVAHRRMRQGLLMRRTDDLAIVAFETPSGDRRFLVYDLRDDLATTLAIGRKLSLDIACTWDGLRRSSELPPDWPRKVVGN